MMNLYPALKKAWDDLFHSGLPEKNTVRFLADEYSIDSEAMNVMSLSKKTPADDLLALLILHYTAASITGLPSMSGEWLSFSSLSVARAFTEKFKTGSIDLLIRKYGDDPQRIFSVLESIPGKKADQADAAIIIEAFESVPVLIELWEADEEFGPGANMLFDKSITGIFHTEDIVIFAETVAAAL